MTALFDRLSQALSLGHERADLDLHIDARAFADVQFKQAAVLIALTEREEPGVLLLHRPSNMRAHPGQVAFPGGRIDPGETPVEAALREANEELGIDPALVRVVAETDTYRTGTGYEITPVVGIVPPDMPIYPNPAEVAQWFEAPASFVLDPVNQLRQAVEWEGRSLSYFDIRWQEHRIWGVTAGILHNLSLRLGRHD